MGLNTKDNQKHYSYDFILGGFHMLAEHHRFWQTNVNRRDDFFLKSCFNFLMSKFLVLAYLSWALRISIKGIRRAQNSEGFRENITETEKGADCPPESNLAKI